MKALKITLGIVVTLVAIVLIAGAIAPTHTHVERSVVIDAPVDFVYPHISMFSNMYDWSPWVELDPNQTVNYVGEDGTVGAIYQWSGNEDVGKGEQEITGMESNHVTTELRFLEPFEAVAIASYDIEETEEGTKVTWSYDGETPYPMNAMNLVMDMDEQLGPDFQKGMNNLNERIMKLKAENTSFDGFDVVMEEMPATTVIGTRSTIGWDEMGAYFAENFPKAFMEVGKAGLEMTGQPMSVTFKWDTENQTADVLAGLPVSSGSVESMESVEISGKCLVINYYGPYEGSIKAHDAMDKYLSWHGKELAGPVIEQYVTDPTEEEDQSKWLTRIIYPVL